MHTYVNRLAKRSSSTERPATGLETSGQNKESFHTFIHFYFTFSCLKKKKKKLTTKAMFKAAWTENYANSGNVYLCANTTQIITTMVKH